MLRGGGERETEGRRGAHLPGGVSGKPFSLLSSLCLSQASSTSVSLSQAAHTPPSWQAEAGREGGRVALPLSPPRLS